SIILIASASSIDAQCDWQSVGKDNDMFFMADGSSLYEPAIASDNAGVQYVAYCDKENSDKISVKRFLNEQWTFLGTPGISTGKTDFVKIGTDNLNRVYVAYKDFANGKKLTVQFYNGFSWSVIGSPGMGADTIVDMDFFVDKTTNHPFVYYTDSTAVSTVIEYNGVGWNTVGATNFGASSMYQGQISTSGGVPYLTYLTYGPGQLNVMKFNGTSWAPLGAAGPEFANAQWNSPVTFDNFNVPHVAFQDFAFNAPSVMYLSGSTWTYLGTPGFVPYATWYNSLAFDSSNNLFMAYTKVTGTAAEIAKYNGTTWSVVSSYATPTNAYITYQYAYYRGMSIDPVTNNLYMLYTENTASPLMGWRDFGVMRYDGVKARVTGSESITGPITGTGAGGAYFDIDKFGTPYVVYSDSLYSDKISVKKYVGNTWVYVGTPGFNTGYTEFAKIAFDTAGVPYVAYRQGSVDIYVMKFDGVAWQNVGAVINNTYDVSLAINPLTNQPHIFYCDVSFSLLGNVKKFNGTSWVSEGPPNFTVGSAAYTNIRFDHAGNQYVAYSDNGLGTKAIVKKLTSGVWTTVGSGTISSAQAHQLKLKVDLSNNLYIVYQDQSASYQPLCHKFNGTSWSVLGSYVTTGYVSDVDMAVDNSNNVFVYFTKQYLNYFPGTVSRFFGGSWIPAGRQYISNSSCKSNQMQINPVNGLPYIGSITQAGVPSGSLLSRGFYLKSLPCNFGEALLGQVKYDVNSSCINDPGEQPLQNQSVLLTSGTSTDVAFTDYTGQYYYTNSAPGTYTIGMGTLSNGYNVACASSTPHATTIVAGSLSNEDFSIACTPSFDFIANSITPIGNWWPNQFVTVWSHPTILKTVCDGSVTPGIIRLIFPPCLTYVVDTTLPLQPSAVSASVTGDTVWYNLADVYDPSPYLYNSVLTRAHICSTATITDTLCIQLSVSASGDTDLTNDNYTRCIPIAASYDPNFKEVTPAGLGSPGFIPDDTGNMLYTVHFQNTGTAPAVNVKLVDTISANLDLSTFEIISSSHAMSGNSLTGGVMTFNFPNIMLPDSTSDELNSHGFVTYRIKLNTGLVPLTEIQNTAYIYFDFNAAIVTNTTLNTIEMPAAIDEHSGLLNDVLVFPNPFSENTRFVIQSKEKEMYSFELTDVLGKKVKSMSDISEKSFQMSRNGLENGIYFYKITGSKGLINTGKLIIK
ncbi:MAG: T9SS type A sorting domain-containing protein, partial [Bacteroidota bacterium]|nr:T9SS type A sorting domain-containing protein [Bacteroidota bacterium]